MELPVLKSFQSTSIDHWISFENLLELYSNIQQDFNERYQLSVDPPVFETPQDKSDFKKTSLPAFLPADLLVKKSRGNAKNIQKVILLFVDVDVKTDHHVLREVLSYNDLEYISYPTISCTDVHPRYRYVLSLTKSVTPEELTIIHKWIHVLTGCLPDTACWDPARIHAVPFRLGGYQRLSYSPGGPVDVDAILAEREILEKVDKLSPSDLFDHFRLNGAVAWGAMRGGKKTFFEPAVKMLKAILGDSQFPREGERDTSATRLAQALGQESAKQHFDWWHVHALLYHARPVVEREWPGEWDTFREKFDRFVFEESTPSDPQQAFEPSRVRIAEMAGGFYTPEMVEAHKEQPDILQVGAQYYAKKIRSETEMEYVGPWSGSSVISALENKLAPNPTIDFLKTTGNGKVTQKNLKDLVKEYGWVTDNVATVLDLTVQGTRFRDGVLLECKNPYRRGIEPRRDDLVEGWIATAFGDDFLRDGWTRETAQTPSGRFVSWLARFPRLDLPLTMLYLSGPPKTGKNLLAKGLCRFWTTDPDPFPIDGQILAKGFQDPLFTDPPLVFLNETAPRGLTLDDLKKQIEATERTINRKYLAETKLRGAARFLAADNNRDILKQLTDERGHTGDSHQAAADRFTMLEMNSEAAIYLESYTKEEVEHAFIHSDGMIAYALWWQQNLDPNTISTTRARFGVMPDPDEAKTAAVMTSSAGISGKAIETLVALLADPQPGKIVTRKQMMFYLMHEEVLMLSLPTLQNKWNDLTRDNRSPPATPYLAKAFDQLRVARTKGSIRATGIDNKQRQFFPIDIRKLKAFVEASLQDAFSWEDVLQGIETVKKQEKRGRKRRIRVG